MAKCKVCGKRGLFQKLFLKRLCERCHTDYQAFLESEPEAYVQNMAVVDGDAGFGERIHAAARALASVRKLAPFEATGLEVKLPTPAQAAIARLSDFPNAATRAFVDSQLPKAQAKSSVGKSPESRMEPYQALLSELLEIRDQVSDSRELERQIQRVREDLDGVDLVAAMEAAEKEEFKGNNEKAVDLYLEALFLARKDTVDDGKQAELIREIQDKVIALGGQLPHSER